METKASEEVSATDDLKVAMTKLTAERDKYMKLYVQAIERSHHWMDLVMQNAAKGDWAQLIEDVGDCLNNVDAVDADSIALWEKAKARADSDMRVLKK